VNAPNRKSPAIGDRLTVFRNPYKTGMVTVVINFYFNTHNISLSDVAPQTNEM